VTTRFENYHELTQFHYLIVKLVPHPLSANLSESDEFWIIHNSSDYQNDAHARLPTAHMTQKRKRGHPKVKEVVLKHRVGRPRKEPLNPENLPPPKRKVGPPPKIKSSGVVVEFGPIVSNPFILIHGILISVS
jgi:hypothetical protein